MLQGWPQCYKANLVELPAEGILLTGSCSISSQFSRGFFQFSTTGNLYYEKTGQHGPKYTKNKQYIAAIIHI